MTTLVLDSGGVSLLSRQSRDTNAGRDAPANQFLKTCDIIEHLPESLARRAAQLRRLAKTGSAVDALIVTYAEPDGTVLTSDPRDIKALAAHAVGVSVLSL